MFFPWLSYLFLPLFRILLLSTFFAFFASNVLYVIFTCNFALMRVAVSSFCLCFPRLPPNGPLAFSPVPIIDFIRFVSLVEMVLPLSCGMEQLELVGKKGMIACINLFHGLVQDWKGQQMSVKHNGQLFFDCTSVTSFLRISRSCIAVSHWHLKQSKSSSTTRRKIRPGRTGSSAYSNSALKQNVPVCCPRLLPSLATRAMHPKSSSRLRCHPACSSHLKERFRDIKLPFILLMHRWLSDRYSPFVLYSP